MQERGQRQQQQGAGSVEQAVEPVLSFERGDLQFWISIAQLIVLLMILNRL